MKNLNPIKAKILRWLVVIFVCGIALTFSGCYGTYYVSDAEYSDLRESHASITYYQGHPIDELKSDTSPELRKKIYENKMHEHELKNALAKVSSPE